MSRMVLGGFVSSGCVCGVGVLVMVGNESGSSGVTISVLVLLVCLGPGRCCTVGKVTWNVCP